MGSLRRHTVNIALRILERWVTKYSLELNFLNWRQPEIMTCELLLFERARIQDDEG
jgi:hypothetical protein